MRTPQHALHHQSGMVLIISIIILILLTIIGVSGMKVTALEEKMAGNDRDQSVAFQAAETALRMGEEQVKKLYTADLVKNFCDSKLNNTANQKGLFSSAQVSKDYNDCNNTCSVDCATDPNPMDSVTWSNNTLSSVAVPAGNLLAGTSARYYITFYYFFHKIDPENNNNKDYYLFTVTAKGAGAKGGEVILRSYFRAMIPS